jgi:hypothetical protein
LEINGDIFIDGSQQGSSLHVSSMATVTQIMHSELVF